MIASAAPAAVFAVGDTVTSGALPLAAAVAALAGLVSFASPCVLPLVPGFLFVLGFTAVFVLGSLFVTTAGRALIEYRSVLMRLGGVVVIVMGLVFLGVGGQREARIRWRPRPGLGGASL